MEDIRKDAEKGTEEVQEILKLGRPEVLNNFAATLHAMDIEIGDLNDWLKRNKERIMDEFNEINEQRINKEWLGDHERLLTEKEILKTKVKVHFESSSDSQEMNTELTAHDLYILFHSSFGGMSFNTTSNPEKGTHHRLVTKDGYSFPILYVNEKIYLSLDKSTLQKIKKTG